MSDAQKKLEETIEDYEENKVFLETENNDMRAWIKKLEDDKKELIKEKDEMFEKLKYFESINNSDEQATDEYRQKIAALENENEKLNYKISKYLSNKKIKKIVESKKLDLY